MDQNGVASHRHRRLPSYDRLFGVISCPSDTDTSLSSFPATTGDELNEDEVFFSSDFSEAQHRRVRHLEKLGILAALPEGNRSLDGQIIHRKPAAISSSSITPSSRAIPSIPKPHSSSEVKYSQSMPLRQFQQSAPMNVPMMPRKPRNGEVFDHDTGRDADDDQMMPPHETVTCVSSKYQKNTFSVLEGVGRTLKGRDLRQVRNAVWRQTGFLD